MAPGQVQLKTAVLRYARRHANADGLALTPVPGLRMMCVDAPGAPLQSTYKPLVCMVLQGAKHMLVGSQAQLLRRGQSIIVSADMPVSGRIVEATPARPYLAVAIEIDWDILHDLAELRPSRADANQDEQNSFVEATRQPLLDCARRLMGLIGNPSAMSALRPAILRELHYWLLAGEHGAALARLTLPENHSKRLAAAIRILRADYRTKLPVERLAAAAAMSLTTFHQHFKRLTTLTPVQYQKRLRLIEARQLMQQRGWQAGRAAFEVGYGSISQFTREYGRLFGTPPKQDALRVLHHRQTDWRARRPPVRV